MVNKFVDGGAFAGEGDSDFAGGTLPFEIRLENSDWNKPEYLPTNEKQNGVNGDKLNCVTQSNHNDFEFQLNQMIAAKTISVGHLDWLNRKGYLDSNGKLNFSEKFNSILNKTAKYRGNWLYKVAEDSRINGLIPQSMLPEKVDEDWDTYYNIEQITREMLDLGKEFLEWFKITYEWIHDKSIANLVKQLQHAPIQIVIPNHAIVEIKSKEELMNYFDSYPPWIREKAQNKVTYYMKLLIDPIERLPEEIFIIKDANSKAVGIWYAAKNPEELIDMATKAGFPIPRNSEGLLDWDNFIQGDFTLR